VTMTSTMGAFATLAAMMMIMTSTSAFTLVMMGAKRGKAGNLKRSLDDSNGKTSGVQGMNKGRGQEITGVTLPREQKIKGWAFGEDRTIASTQVDGKYYAVDGRCPRCGFDLFKGTLLNDEDVWGPDPCVACPTCAATYNMRTGKAGNEMKRTGLAGFVNGWAQTATLTNSAKDATAYVISVDDGGKVFCRER